MRDSRVKGEQEQLVEPRGNWAVLASAGQNPVMRKLRWGFLRQYRRLSAADFSDQNRRELSQVLGEEPWLSQEGWLWQIDRIVRSGDNRVAKFRMVSASHGDACETVWMRTPQGRVTVCVSTQIGCAVGCSFCATGRMGFRRQLSSWEILEQVLRSGMLGPKSNVSDDDNAVTTDTKRRIDPTIVPVRNIVFMGMGEPLHNLSAVTESLERLTDEAWFGLSPRTITVSTAGVPRGMIALAQRFPRLRLALSLHSAEPSKRRELVPHAVGDLEKLRSTIAEVNRLQEGPVWIEIALLAGVNDGLDDARKLVEFCEGLRVEVNVIPYNDTSHSAEALPQFGQAASYRAPAIARVDAYIGELRRSGIFTTFRKTLGESIQAACGQLVAPVRDVSK